MYWRENPKQGTRSSNIPSPLPGTLGMREEIGPRCNYPLQEGLGIIIQGEDLEYSLPPAKQLWRVKKGVCGGGMGDD